MQSNNLHCIRSISFLNVAPAAPSSLAAVATSSTSIELNWTAPSPANGIIVHYTVLVNSTSDSTAISSGSNATTYVVTGLVPCALYTFAVSATTGCAGCTGAYSGALANVSTAANSVLSIRHCTLYPYSSTNCIRLLFVQLCRAKLNLITNCFH